MKTAYTPVAFFATLFTPVPGTAGEIGTTGMALRCADGRVFFRTEATGLWSELVDADRPRLHLHGNQPMSDAQAITDGDRTRKASRTLDAA